MRSPILGGRDPSWPARWVGIPIMAGTLLAALVDPSALAGYGRERVSAVLLQDGSAYFGHLRDDPWSESIELRDVYYFQDARATTTNLPFGLVRRGAELHQPADGMRIRRDKVVQIEQVGAGSDVMRAIAADRAIRGSSR